MWYYFLLKAYIKVNLFFTHYVMSEKYPRLGPSPFSLLPSPLRVGQGREKGREKNPFDFEGAGLNYRFLLLYKKYILIKGRIGSFLLIMIYFYHY